MENIDLDFNIEKPKILLVMDHFYTFMSIGRKISVELQKDFEIILFIPVSYKEEATFQETIEKLSFYSIEYYQFTGMSFYKHRNFCKKVKHLIQFYEPDAVLQRDYISIENQYVFHISRLAEKKIQNIVILGSMPSTEKTKASMLQIKYIKIQKYFGDNIISKKLLLPLSLMRRLFQSWYTNIFLFILIHRCYPYLKSNYMNNIDIIPQRDLFDAFYVFHPYEKNFLEKLFQRMPRSNMIRVELITYPSDEVKIKKYRANSGQRMKVAILPSLLGLRPAHKDRKNLEKWVMTINSMKRILPTHDFYLKLHPGRDPEIREEIVQHIKRNCHFISELDHDNDAAELISGSEVIVSDVSTVLWETQFNDEKLGISIQLEYYASSEVMKNYDNILCVKSATELDSSDILRIIETQKQKASAMYPSLRNSLISRLASAEQSTYRD